MTGEELVLAVRAEQGFVLMGATMETPIGTVIGQVGSSVGTARIPVRVVAAATFAEWQAQCRLAARLTGDLVVWHKPKWRYFYRVEAAD